MLPPRNQWNEKALRGFVDQSLEESGGVLYHEAAFALDAQDDDAPLLEVAKSKPARSISGTASVEEISRSGLLIRIAGLDLTHFNENNPIVLAQHQTIAYGTLMPGAIGTVEKAFKTHGGSALKFRNMTFDTDPISDAWYQKISKGIVRMVSVGVVPIEVRYVEETIGKGAKAKRICYVELVESELLDISPVCVGANRGAYMDRPARRENASALIQLAERLAELNGKVNALAEREQQFTNLIKQLSAERDAAAVSRLLDTASSVQRCRN